MQNLLYGEELGKDLNSKTVKADGFANSLTDLVHRLTIITIDPYLAH